MEKFFAALNAVIVASNAVRDAGIKSHSIQNSLLDMGREIATHIRESAENSITTGSALNDGLIQSERNLILAGNHIDAIRLIRNRTGRGLKESKELADAFRSEKMFQDYTGGLGYGVWRVK